MKLSILTCTLPERSHYLKRLSNIITRQVTNEVEFLVDPRGRHISTGEKRNSLIQQAKGDYVCFVDDDDIVDRDYVSYILKALQSNPDCVTFEGWMTTDGRSRVDWVIKLGEKYEERGGIIYRWPNHLAVIKKALIHHVLFPHRTVGEDYVWSKMINDMGILKTSVHIPHKIYHYDFKTSK